MRQVTHQARAYPGFRSMEWLGAFLLPAGWSAGPQQGYHPAVNLLICTWVERGTWSVKCLAQEHSNDPGQGSNLEGSLWSQK